MEKDGKIILVGGGGHAVSLCETFGNQLAGYLAPVPSPHLNIKWLGTDEEAPVFVQNGFIFHMAFVYAGSPDMMKRESLLRYYKSIDAKFVSLISESAFISEHSEIGHGSAILNRAVINKAQIADNSVVNTGAIIEHDTLIGNNTFIGPGVVVGGGVNIGDNCFIGLGANLRNGINIASGVTVGMGSIVTKDIISPGVYYGII